MVGGVLFYHWCLAGIGQILPKKVFYCYVSLSAVLSLRRTSFFGACFFICLLVGLFSRLMKCPVQDIWKATRKPRELTTVLFLKSRGTFVVCLLFNSFQSLPMLFCCVMSRDFFLLKGPGRSEATSLWQN